MKTLEIVRSITFGFFFGLLAILLIPFLIVYNITELYGITELYEWVGVPPLFIFAKRKNPDQPKEEKQ